MLALNRDLNTVSAIDYTFIVKRKMFCKLAVLMKERDTRLSQRELSRQTGLSVTAINRLHNNEFDRVDTATIEKLCDYFNCEVGDLLILKNIEEKV